MGLPELDHGVSYSFSVTIDGVQIPHVIDVSGLKQEVDKIDHKSNDSTGKFLARAIAGKPKPGEVTISRGVTSSKAISDWFKTSLQGDMSGARKTAQISILDYMGMPIMTYSLSNVWVKSFELGSLKAGATEPLTEKFTLSFDELEVGG
jgi:phage tail-like protein